MTKLTSLFSYAVGFLVLIQVVTVRSLPLLNIDGFTWAENLAFDGLGNLFVSDAVQGKLQRIFLCESGTSYCNVTHLSEGLRDIGGLQISPDGLTIYAGATLANRSNSIISASTSSTDGSFEVISITKNKPNGMACDWANNILYYTDEGTGSEDGGTLTAFDLTYGNEMIIKDHITGADGAWMDSTKNLLYVGELLTMKVMVFNTSSSLAQYVDEYDGLSSLGLPHMLDDFTLERSGSNEELTDTVLFGADWTGKAVWKFPLGGSDEPVLLSPPAGVELFEPTSVRWGHGPGFDPKSLYVTEGGGIVPSMTNRRVLQFTFNF